MRGGVCHADMSSLRKAPSSGLGGQGAGHLPAMFGTNAPAGGRGLISRAAPAAEPALRVNGDHAGWRTRRMGDPRRRRSAGPPRVGCWLRPSR